MGYENILHLILLLTHSAAPSPAFEGGVKKCRSGLTLSIRLSSRRRQAPAFMLGSRRVDLNQCNFFRNIRTLDSRMIVCLLEQRVGRVRRW